MIPGTQHSCRVFGSRPTYGALSEYVFILNPWWNPAVEAQAIDRAHRLGQTQSVNAYRMICCETVEGKIIELQKSKRDVADAIVSQNKSVIGQLTAGDL